MNGTRIALSHLPCPYMAVAAAPTLHSRARLLLLAHASQTQHYLPVVAGSHTPYSAFGSYLQVCLHHVDPFREDLVL